MEAMKNFYVNELNPELKKQGLTVQGKKEELLKSLTYAVQ